MEIRSTEPCMSFRVAITGKETGGVNYERSQNVYNESSADVSLFISVGSASVSVGIVYCCV